MVYNLQAQQPTSPSIAIYVSDDIDALVREIGSALVIIEALSSIITGKYKLYSLTLFVWLP